MRLRLHVLVFVAGACSLATEMAGARLLAPFFGTSNVVWANVIGLILVYLSLGYWLGGKFADRYPDERALGLVVLFAAVTIAILPFATRPLFYAAATAFDDVSAGAFVASFVGTLLMFALPVTALGAVSPWAIRLAVTDIARGGRRGGAAVRAVDARLDRRHVPAGAVPDPDDRDAPDAAARRARAGAGGAADAAPPGGARVRRCWRAAARAAGPGEGGQRRQGRCSRASRRTSSSRSCGSGTATPCCT